MSARNRLAIGAGAAICLSLLAGLAVRATLGFYERSLAAQHPVQPLRAGDISSRLLLVGDSRVSQWARHSSFDAAFLSFPGASSWQLAMYFDDVNLEVARDKTVVLQIGINDLRLLGMQPEAKARVVAATTSNILRLAQRLSNVAREVVILSILPANRPGLLRRLVWSDAVDEAVEDINTALAERTGTDSTTGSIRVLDLSSEFLALRDTGYEDTLHLNATGYRRLNEMVEQGLAGVI